MNSVINYATTYKPLLAGNKLALCKLFSLDRHPENQELNPVQESGRRRSLGTERRLCTSAPCSRRAALGLPAPPVSLELGSYVLAPKYWAKYWSLYSAGLSGRQDVLWFCVHRLKQDDFLELSFGKACEHREMCYDNLNIRSGSLRTIYSKSLQYLALCVVHTQSDLAWKRLYIYSIHLASFSFALIFLMRNATGASPTEIVLLGYWDWASWRRGWEWQN